MAITLRSFLILCGILGFLTGTVKTCCPKGWTQLDDRCFIYQDEEREFADAEAVCQILGGNLASVHSAFEYVAVLALIKERSEPNSNRDVWLGLHEAIELEAYQWTDGSPFDFNAFNSDDGNGSCVEIDYSDLSWDNADCDDTMRYVCARDAECGH
ncbi:galactose-specific lectin nattectin-like [Stigmatopora nigra]